MPYALCPMPYARQYLIFLRKAIFHQEAAQLQILGKHPQIPELLAHFEQNGRQYLVQEFIDG
ncbi:hypothetical protein, partial [Microcoleus anatoxicus]